MPAKVFRLLYWSFQLSFLYHHSIGTKRPALSIMLECLQWGLQGLGGFFFLVGKNWTKMMTIKEALEILDSVSFRNTGNFHSKCQFLLKIHFFVHRLVGNVTQMPLQQIKREQQNAWMPVCDNVNGSMQCLKQGRSKPINLAMITVKTKAAKEVEIKQLWLSTGLPCRPCQLKCPWHGFMLHFPLTQCWCPKWQGNLLTHWALGVVCVCVCVCVCCKLKLIQKKKAEEVSWSYQQWRPMTLYLIRMSR